MVEDDDGDDDDDDGNNLLGISPQKACLQRNQQPKLRFIPLLSHALVAAALQDNAMLFRASARPLPRPPSLLYDGGGG